MLYPFFRLFSPARSRPLCTAEARKKRRGFNLIESAIVLGVVGLVIGGIWVAASEVNESVKINKAIQGYTFIKFRADEIWSLSNIPTGEVTIPTSTAISVGLVPNDWIFGDRILDPWGRNVFFAFYWNRLQIAIFNSSPSSCVKIINGIAGRLNSSSQTSLQQVYRLSPFAASSTFPIPINSALCQSINSEIGFMFYFSRTN